jgi:hypothetical protein
MDDRFQGSSPIRFSRNMLLLALLFLSGLIFFLPVRNNTFWHSSDFLYLSQALMIDQSWREIFAAAPHQTFQPLVNMVFYLEFKWFGLNAWHFYLFNIAIHSINAFLVYMIVFTLLRSNLIAILSSLLFVFAVGNYGKAVMVASGISDLLITMLTLLTLLFYFKNEREKGGGLFSVWFISCLTCFLLSLLSKATSFSILGCMLTFNVFFRQETGKRAFHRNFIVITLVALAVLIVKLSVLHHLPGRSDLHFNILLIARNFGSYLVRMVFPIHYSSSVSSAGPMVQFIYRAASEIRLFTFLCILSYSVFGFIFGNRAIRFFITWTYITVLPFCFFNFPLDWLNIRYLYLVSVGFSMLLASGTVLASQLLHQRSRRRLLPYLVPLLFVLMSHMIASNLDKNYESLAASPGVKAMESSFLAEYYQHQALHQKRESP